MCVYVSICRYVIWPPRTYTEKSKFHTHHIEHFLTWLLNKYHWYHSILYYIYLYASMQQSKSWLWPYNQSATPFMRLWYWLSNSIFSRFRIFVVCSICIFSDDSFTSIQWEKKCSIFWMADKAEKLLQCTTNNSKTPSYTRQFTNYQP